jgi:hypothetical protein
MIKLTDLLKEAKQVGTLYHFTSLNNLKPILESGILMSTKGRKYISFTRNKNLSNLGVENSQVRLTINGDDLSNKYKLIPYAQTKPENPTDAYLFKSNPKIFNKSEPTFEAEVVIPIEKYDNKVDILPYIERIDIIDRNYIKDRPLNSEEKKQFEKYNIPINYKPL